jgi:hypothetical protein
MFEVSGAFSTILENPREKTWKKAPMATAAVGNNKWRS